MRFIVLFVFSIAASLSFAQTTADFENLFPGEESTNLGQDAGGEFRSGKLVFPNNYDPDFMSFEGWAISSTTDTLTPGFSNQSSAIAGSGHAGSSTYAFAYAFSPIRVIPDDAAEGDTMVGLYLTNSTYAYYSMLNGDQFSKRFGGVDGTDPDFFLLTIEAYLNGELKDEKVEFFLADYRFENENEDYIVDEWTWVDLTSLGKVDSLEFSLISSDVGDFGMNTPAYFCIDDFISLDRSTSTGEQDFVKLSLYPNPVIHDLEIISAEPIISVQLFTGVGELVSKHSVQHQRRFLLDLSDCLPGIFNLSIRTSRGVINRKIVKF